MMAASCNFDFQEWLKNVEKHYMQLSDDDKNLTLDHLIEASGSQQLIHLYNHMEKLVYRDFLKLLLPELREHLLSYLDSKSLLAACCVNKTWLRIVSSSAKAWQRACRSLGIIIDKDVHNYDSVYWKSFFIEMARRRFHMKTCKSFTAKTYDRHLRRVTAVYYANGRLATASDSKTIQIWDCLKDQCIMTIRTDVSVAAIKFDDHLLIASTYLGHLVSWDVKSGQRLTEYMRHVGAVFTFDYSVELNILVSGSSDTKVKLWSLSGGNVLTTLDVHTTWVLKVMLKPFPAQQNSSCLDRHFLFCMDQTKIVIWTVSFAYRSDGDGLYISSLYSIPIRVDDTNFFTPGLYFDGINLFFIKQNPQPPSYSLLCKWDIRLKKMVSETELNLKVKALLGVGEKYFAAVVTQWRNKVSPNFLVLDKETLEVVAQWHLPPSKASTPDFSQMILGDSQWLNGMDGKNDQGVLLAAGLEDNSVYILKWIPRISEDKPHSESITCSESIT